MMLGLALLLAPRAHAKSVLQWQVTAYADGHHNAFTDLASWKGRYYLCFRHATSHMAMNGEIRVMVSDDMKHWAPCTTLSTFGDDRDPHFTQTPDRLYVFFGTWDLSHQSGHALPDRHEVRSYCASTDDGKTWSKIQGVYKPGFWLWRVRYHDGAFYSAAYTAKRPTPKERETRLLRSKEGLNWDLVSTVTKVGMAGESDMQFNADGSMWLITRTGVKPGHAWRYDSGPQLQHWTGTDLGVLVHAPVIARWHDRIFVAGRGRGDKGSVTRVWELVDGKLQERLTLPSSGDTSYPGLIPCPDAQDSDHPAFFISWYSQHETHGNAANVYVGRILIDP